MDTDVTRRIASDTGANFFGTTRSINIESCRSAANKLALVIDTLAVYSWQCFTANQHPDLCRLLQFLGQPTASACGHLLHRVFQSSGWPIKSPLTFFPLRRTMGRMFVLCHCVFTVIADIELRNSGVIPLHEAPWTGCLGV